MLSAICMHILTFGVDSHMNVKQYLYVVGLFIMGCCSAMSHLNMGPSCEPFYFSKLSYEQLSLGICA